MTEPHTIEHLQNLGLTEYESRAYLAAVKLGRARPGDLSEESGVPQARIYDIVDDLKAKGLVEVYAQRDGKEVMAPSPQTVLTQFKHRQMNELSEDVSTAIADLEEVYRRTEENPDPFVTMVSREESALRHIKRAAESAEWWLTISIEGRLYPELREYLVDGIERNVTVRLLLSEEDPAIDRYSFPDELRVRYRLTADTFIAADRTYGVFSSKHPAKSGQPYIVTQEPNLVQLFQTYSEQIWTTSEAVQAGESFSRRYLDPWHAIIDLEEHLDSRTDLYATVYGTNTDTHRRGTWEGEIVDYELTGPVEADYTISTPVEASLTLDTDAGCVTVGGWKATFEEVAADGIEITRL